MPNRVQYRFVLGDGFTRVARQVEKRTRAIRLALVKLGPAARTSGRLVRGAFAGMKAAALGFQASMAPLLVAFTGIAAAMKFFSTGTGFQDAMADFGAITRTTGKDLEFVRMESLRLGKASKVGSAEVATAFKLIASGQSQLLEDPEALSNVVEQALLLKNAAGSALDMSTAARVLTQSMNGFNVEASEANRLVNVLAAGAGIGASELGEIGLAFREAGQAAQLSGLSFEETNAALQVMAKKGLVVGVQAGTKFRSVMSKMEVKLAKGIRPSVIGLSATLEKLAPIMNDTTALTQIFGEEMFIQARVLIQNRALVDEWTKAFTGTNVAQEQAAAQLSTITAKMRGLGVTIKNFLIKVFDRLAPQFDEVIAGISKFLSSITDDDIEGFANALGSILSLLQSIARVGALVGEVLGPVFKLLGVSLSGLSDLGTLITGGDLTAANSKSLSNAVRIEKSEASIKLQVSAGPGTTVDSLKTATSGPARLKTGINNEAAA